MGLWTVLGSRPAALAFAVLAVVGGLIVARRSPGTTWGRAVAASVLVLVALLLYAGWLATPARVGHLECQDTLSAVHQPDLDPATARELGGRDRAPDCRSTARLRLVGGSLVLGLVVLGAGWLAGQSRRRDVVADATPPEADGPSGVVLTPGRTGR